MPLDRETAESYQVTLAQYLSDVLQTLAMETKARPEDVLEAAVQAMRVQRDYRRVVKELLEA